MPNWCKGTLKVRGTNSNIKRFVLEGLHPVGFLGDSKEKLSINKWGDIESNETCWIEGTIRGFVDGVMVYLSEYDEDDEIIACFDSRFAWAINADDLLKICIKHNVDMKIHGFERGMEFNQVVEIINGQIIKNEELEFENYEWDCICPTMGG